ncbi:hypothetical protein [Streptomyces sp. OE57]|uniref:hypothetical protein n=1 Tax=Streptomyces lacaronensis TaxID=3379885 RepID=UPI0039B742A7
MGRSSRAAWWKTSAARLRPNASACSNGVLIGTRDQVRNLAEFLRRASGDVKVT